MQFLKTIQVLQDMGKYIRQQARSNLTKQKKNVDRTLYESITYGVHNQQKKIDLLVEMAEYGKFQDQGVRGLKASPINTMNSPTDLETNATDPNNSRLGKEKKYKIKR